MKAGGATTNSAPGNLDREPGICYFPIGQQMVIGKCFKSMTWFEHQSCLSLFLLALLFSDIGAHLLAPLAHSHGHGEASTRLCQAQSAPESEDQDPCGIPGHCCGAFHHHHYASVINTALFTQAAALITPAEWVWASVPSHSQPVPKLIRAPPSI
jgi:hypothetical protein